MRKRRQIELFSISFLDLLSGALGAVIILYVAVPKNRSPAPETSRVKTVPAEFLAKAQIENEKLKAEVARLEKAEALTPVPVVAEAPAPNQADLTSNFDTGFKFKGKNVVFLVDTSFSMWDEDRMGQVKAGLKMLLTSMSENIKFDLVQFPLGERAPFKTMWGVSRECSKFWKIDAFEFIKRLQPSGGTPTRDVLLFVLEHYPDATDIVLLTDGLPTLHNSNKKDDIYDIMKAVKEANVRNVQINTVGVGTDFLAEKGSNQYIFLSQLAESTGGFFVGF